MWLDRWMLRPPWPYLLEPGQAKPDVGQLPQGPVGQLEDQGPCAILQGELPNPDQTLPPVEFLLQFPYGLFIGKGLICLTLEGPREAFLKHLVAETKSLACWL